MTFFDQSCRAARPALAAALWLLAATMAPPAAARPISYPGGWSVMSVNDAAMNSVEVLHTLTPALSVGWRHDYDRAADAHGDAGEINLLLARRNTKNAQANLYLKAGAGIAYDGRGKTGALAYGGIAADAETRRWYVSYSNEFLTTGGLYDKAAHSARIGVAPYVGDYGDLHTWLMLQADFDPRQDDTFRLTPLVRLFRGTTLGEAGFAPGDGLYFHIMKTF